MKRIDSERTHHDKWAKEDLSDVANDFEHFLALENRWIAQHLPPLAGLDVLDIGCGLGEASLFFARGAARVTAVDISEEMVKRTVAAIRRKGKDARGIVSSAEALDIGREKFDVIYTANVLHHLERPEDLIGKIAGSLRPGGMAFFVEPLRYNPVINIYRRMASGVRTRDERPVGFGVLDVMKKHFGVVSYSTTWLLSLVIFLKYYFINRVHPNDDRYWKRILREPQATRRWMEPLVGIDKLLCKCVPPARYMCWNIVIAAKNPTESVEG